ncbi:MAG: hypothetical protein KME29_03815 [Calothrix sp. FI2-JRJ7]|jgi:hypothetical protein|nr:hypothetical protein [Calothrix sp. FI2-JRJ7]MBW4598747.1 hypothetical protein [Calothrix sp. FI2-JRJ7]
MNKPKRKVKAGQFEESPGQIPLFNVLPIHPITTVHDTYWDEIVKSAPEHLDNNEDSALTQNSIPSQESVRVQLQAPQSAPEHYGSNEGGVLLQNSTPSQESVRVQLQAPQSAPEHYGSNEEWEALQVSTLSDESVRVQFLPSKNLNHQPHGKKKPECKQDTHWVEVYWVKRGQKKHYYYRYCWMIGRKTNKLHLGSVSSNDGKMRRREVLELIDAGALPTKIVEYVKKSNNSRN